MHVTCMLTQTCMCMLSNMHVTIATFRIGGLLNIKDLPVATFHRVEPAEDDLLLIELFQM